MAAAAKSAVVHPDRGSVPTTITPPVNEGGEGIAQRLASQLARSLKCLLDRLLASWPGQPEGAKPGPGHVVHVPVERGGPRTMKRRRVSWALAPQTKEPVGPGREGGNGRLPPSLPGFLYWQAVVVGKRGLKVVWMSRWNGNSPPATEGGLPRDRPGRGNLLCL